MSQPNYEAYPNYVMKKPDSSHSNGQYGPVFIVLAVIAVISAVACAVGRLCNRQHSRVAKEPHHHVKEEHRHVKAVNNPKVEPEKQGPSLGPTEWESTQRPIFKLRERGDGELGFDKRIPSVRNLSNGGGTVAPPHYSGGGLVAPPHFNGVKPHVRFADNV